MITETIFIILFASAIIFLVLGLKYENSTFAAFSLVLCLLVGIQLMPGAGGVQYQTGAIISSTSPTTITNTYGVYTEPYLGLVFFIMVIYLVAEIVSFRRAKGKQKQENIDQP